MSFEFFVHMRPSNDTAEAVASWRAMATACSQTASHDLPPHAEAIRRRLQNPSTDRDDITRQLLARLVVDKDRVLLHWSRAGLHHLLGIEQPPDDQPNSVEEIAIKIKRQGQGKRIFLPAGERKSASNQPLIKAVVRAHAWRRMLESEDGLSVRKLAARQSLSHRYINRLLPLAWLAPDVVEAIIDGTQLPEVSLDQLTAGFSIEWSEQRRLLTLGSATNRNRHPDSVGP